MKKQESLIAYSPNTISALWYNQNKFTQFTIATEYARLLLPVKVDLHTWRQVQASTDGDD